MTKGDLSPQDNNGGAHEDDDDFLALSLGYGNHFHTELSPELSPSIPPQRSNPLEFEQQPYSSPPRPTSLPPPSPVHSRSFHSPPYPSPSLTVQYMPVIQIQRTRSLFCNPSSSSSPPLPLSPPPLADLEVQVNNQQHLVSAPPPAKRQRRNPPGKSETVIPPFAWATDRRATVQTMDDLLAKEILTISGGVQCRKCEAQYEMELDLRQKFLEVREYILRNMHGMHDRAPEVWKNPALPACQVCKQENSARPVISTSKKAINWLFLLLGQWLGCCTLEQLRSFCKHTGNHRTGAKDRVLYLTYLTLCKQLDPTFPSF